MGIDRKQRLKDAIEYAISTDNKRYYEEEQYRYEVANAKNVCVFGAGSFF